MPAPSPTKALLIWNPAAGLGRLGRRWSLGGPRPDTRPIRQLRRALETGGWTVTLAETQADSGARQIASRALEDGYSVVVAAGGDGTLHEIVEVLLAAGPKLVSAPTLAAVPWGTANIFAHAMGCPRAPEAAARWLLNAHTVARPLGLARREGATRYFLSVASIGLDAAVVHELDSRTKHRWGKLAYVGAAIARQRSYFPAAIEFSVADGDVSTSDGLIAALTPFYGGRLRLTGAWPPASAAAPGVEVIALALRDQPRALLRQALSLGFTALDRAPGVEALPPGPIRILTPDRPLELDGEAAGCTPVVLDVLPEGIRVLAQREATWRRPEQSGRPLPASEARRQATSGSDQAKSGEPLRLVWLYGSMAIWQ